MKTKNTFTKAWDYSVGQSVDRFIDVTVSTVCIAYMAETEKHQYSPDDVPFSFKQLDIVT